MLFRSVLLFCSLDRPDARLAELLLAAGAAREAAVARLALVAPYLCYMRQDMAFRPGEAVSQRHIARLLGQVEAICPPGPECSTGGGQSGGSPKDPKHAG